MGVYENTIQARADQLKWKTGFVSAIADKYGIPGASEASLSKAFNNVKDLPTAQTALPLSTVLQRFIKMTEAFQPFKLRFDDPAEAKLLLDSFESGKLLVKIEKFDSVNVIQPFYVIFIGPQLFERVSDQRILNTTDFIKCAAFKTWESASAVAGLLRSMGVSATRTTSITNVRRDPSTIHDSIRDFGFEETSNVSQ